MKPPGGVVTIVFAEGGASAADREPFLRAARAAAARTGGCEVKETARGLMLAFPAASGAAEFSLALQESAPESRVGVHTGEAILQADVATGRPDYIGPSVNRAARIAGAAQPGQTLLSQAARDAARDALSRADVADLGRHRLRGFDQPERLFQILPPSQAGRVFPPPETVVALLTNLPAQAASFVGREREVAEIERLLGGGERLVSLTGPAGAGKTRLAVRAASRLLAGFEGGAWFADLSEARGAAEVADAAMRALGIPPSPGVSASEQVARALRLRAPILLVLDTFDRAVADAAETVGAWRERAPGAAFLLTSREACRLDGEREIRLDPLAAPPRGSVVPGPGAAARALEFEAVRLFRDRALEVKPDFRLTDDVAPDVAEICADLDGLPLAVELAAARAKVLDPAAIRRKLDQKFQLLRTSRQDTVRRQHTLAGAIEWSFEGLSAWEKEALLQASVFRGGFFEEAAAVLDLSTCPGAPAPSLAARALAARSLLASAELPFGRRFRVYGPIRDWAAARWAATADAEARRALEKRHALWFAEESARLDAMFPSPGEAVARGRTDADAANFLAASACALGRADGLGPEVAGKALLALTWLSERVRKVEGLQEALERALAALEHGEGIAARHTGLRLRQRLAMMLYHAGEHATALAVAEKLLRDARSYGDAAGLARALRTSGAVRWHRGEYAQALEAFREAAGLARMIGDRFEEAFAVHGIGACLLWNGRAEEALSQILLGERLHRELGNRYGVAGSLNLRGLALKELDRDGEARAVFEEALAEAESLRYPGLISTIRGNLAGTLSDAGEFEAALEMFRQNAATDRQLGSPVAQARWLGNLGVVRLRQRRWAEAREALEASLAGYRTLGDPAPVGATLINLALAVADGGDRERGLALLDEAREVEERRDDRPGVADTWTQRARMLLDLGRPREAWEAASRAREILRDCGRTGGYVDAQAAVALGVACARLGLEAEARRAAEEARRLEGILGRGKALWSPESERFWQELRQAAAAGPA